MEKEQIRYLHKDGMARRINNEWVIDDLYKTEITFPMRVTIGEPAPLLYEQQVEEARYPVGKNKPISIPMREQRERPKRPSAAVLVEQYVTENMSIRELEVLYGRGTMTIQSWLEDAGLKKKGTRSRYKKQEV